MPGIGGQRVNDRPTLAGAGSDAVPGLPGTVGQNAEAVELAATSQRNFEELGIQYSCRSNMQVQM